MLDVYDVYETYISVKTHFTVEEYDAVYHNFNVKGRGRLDARYDKSIFRQVGNTFNNISELGDFFLSGFVSGGADSITYFVDIEARENYKKWKQRKDNLEHFIINESVDYITKMKELNITFKELIEPVTFKHPKLLVSYLGDEISLETLVMWYQSVCKTKWVKISETTVWPRIEFLIRKYNSFLTLTPKKSNDIMKVILRNSN